MLGQLGQAVLQLQPRGIVAGMTQLDLVHRQQARPLLGLLINRHQRRRCRQVLVVDQQDALVGFLRALLAVQIGLGDLGGPEVQVDLGRRALDALGQGQQHLAQLVPLRLLAVQRLQLVVLTGLAVQLAQGAHRLLVRRLQPDDLAIDLDGLRGGKQLLGQQRADALQVRDLVLDVFGARPLPRDDLDQRRPPLLTIV